MFKIIQKRAHVVNGILYCDPDVLRMMMYLELSRPRGEVKRWKKVFERLTLLNNTYPLTACNDDIQLGPVSEEIRRLLLDYCLKRSLVMAGPEFIELMYYNKGTTLLQTLAKRGGPIIFF